MKRFRFALRPLALLRANSEMRALESFAAAVRRCIQGEQELAAARRRAAESEAAVIGGRRERYTGTFAAAAVGSHGRECAAVAAAEASLAAARDDMQQRMSDYFEAHRRMEIVRRIEANARRAHGAASLREEQAAFDELSGGRYARAVTTPTRGAATS